MCCDGGAEPARAEGGAHGTRVACTRARRGVVDVELFDRAGPVESARQFSMSTMSVARLRSSADVRTADRGGASRGSASEHARTSDREQKLLSGRTVGGLDGGMHGHLTQVCKP